MSIEELTINDSSSHQVELGRNEKKARKALEAVGLKKVEGITRVVLKRPRGILLVVANPEVYKSSVSDCYIVFGEAKLEDNSSAAQLAAAQQVAASQQAAQASLAAGGFGEGHSKTLEDLLREAEAGEGEGEGDDAPDLIPSDTTSSTNKKSADKATVAASAAEPEEEDIKLVMQQANVDREKAVRVIKENDGDMINAIMAASS